MSFFLKIFSSKKSEDDNCKSATENYHESGKFCRESRVDQIDSSILSMSCDNEATEGIASIITRTLDRWNPETCVRLLRMPSVQNYSGLCKLISKSDRNWMIEFLDMGGLQVLFESVDRLSSKNTQSTRLERTLLLLQCVKCLKAVVNSHIALEHIVRQQKTYVRKIAEVLSSCNPLVKKQLFDFMSTLCVFSEGGHYLTLDVFENYRVTKKLRYKFDVLLIEMKQAEVMPYVGAVLGLINCIILGACGFRFRTRIRNEFLVLGLHDLLESLKQIPEEEVQLQCSVFFKSQMADEEYARSVGIHSSFSHFALFQVLLDKIEDTPHSASFLVLLQNLNQLDPTDLKTDYVWSLLEEISERALSGAGSVLRNWMLKECRRNSFKSTATQTCFYVSSSLSLEDSVTHSKYSLCDDDCEKDSIKSFSSRDSGVPVSRNPSFASNGPRSPDCMPLKQKDIYPAGFLANNTDMTDAITENDPADKTKNLFNQEESPFIFTNNSSKHTQTDTLKEKPHGVSSETSPLSLRSESPIPLNDNLVEEGKIKKTFSFSFFNRSKKYSLPKCSPTVKINLPSPDTPELRSGMTSMDVKRSRKQSCTPLNDRTPEDKGIPSSSRERQTCSNGPPPPPPPPPQHLLGIPGNKNLRSSWSGNSAIKQFDKRQHYTLPMPKSKMKTLNWAKIPSSHVSVHSIWSEINQESEALEVNFEEMEKLFCQSEHKRKEPKIRQRKEATREILLLDSKRSLSIGIFLKQFKGGLEEVIEFIRQFQHKDIGAEKLRTLLHLLPDSNEVKLLMSHTEDVKKLGTAEQFLIRLSSIDHYECLVEGMLLLEEFPTSIQVLHDSVQSLLEASQELLTNKGFKNFLKLILVTGNFMNSGSYAGNAVGFRLSTLPKLMETRANRPRITLLHYLVEETQKRDGINFTNELLEKLNRCSRLTMESLSMEIAQLDMTMHKMKKKIDEENGQLKKHFSAFIQNGMKHITILKKKMEEINKISIQLANRFCEDEKKFKLEECLSVVSGFCAKIKIANAENEDRKTAEEKLK